ncbi:MAG: FAD-dependent oxidoreductase [Ginsengibacter sp.]|jgi:glycine/D-amino acid oxidase-like deaminating enzyme
MLSYWESQSFLHYHYIIIGSGITGLSTAIELKEKYPLRSVLVLERGLLPTGASTRNAGFACMGSVTELLDDLKDMTEEEVVKLVEWRKKGLEKLRKRLGDQTIQYAERGSFELISEEEKEAPDHIEYLNKLLQNSSREPVFKLANDKIDAFGFSKENVLSLIETNGEGELHTGKMMRALIDLAFREGIEIKTGANVQDYSQEDEGVSVNVLNSFSREKITFLADKLILCTNAFTTDLLPEVDIHPGRGQVLITAPIKDLKIKGTFHFDKGYYYFREIDGRILLGGGRNLDFKTEENTSFELNSLIQQALEEKLSQMIIPGIPFTIEQRWSGIMAFGPNKFPIIRQFSENVYGAFRLGGMGVALGSKVAEKLAQLIIETD